MLLGLLKVDVPNFDCKKYLPGNGCALPMLPGHYGGKFGGDDALHISLPHNLTIPDALKHFLDGKVKIEAHVSNAAGSEIICAKTEIELTTD